MVISPFTPADLPALVAFLNEALRGHRHWAPITAGDFTERVLSSPVFDPAGLILAREGDRVAGGVHAFKPVPPLPVYEGQPPRHAIAWLAIAPDMRGRGLGDRLLNAAEDYLYYCPFYFAWQSTPLYGVVERLWAPWYGSPEHMALSAVSDREQIAWLGRHGYHAAFPGGRPILDWPATG